MAYKFVVSFPDSWEAMLKERAWQKRMSMAEYIRKAIESYGRQPSSAERSKVAPPPVKSKPVPPPVKASQPIDAVSKRSVPVPVVPYSPIVAGKVKVAAGGKR